MTQTQRFGDQVPKRSFFRSWWASAMADEAKLYRELAEAQRVIAAGTTLPNVRNRALHSAAQWDELASRAERAQAGAEARQGRAAYSSLIARISV